MRITRDALIRAEQEYRAGKYGFDPERGPRPLNLSKKWRRWAAARGCLLFTALLHTVAFPPFDLSAAAFVFAVPVFLYALRRPRWVEYVVVTYAAFLISWLVLLEWLRHVTIVGTIALAATMAVFPTVWCAVVRWAVPRAPWSDLLARLMAVLGLAGLWVVLEWVRSWFLTGFPWATLATTQWRQPMMLQGAAIGGGWLVSFTLVLFALALGSYVQRLWLWVRERRGRFCPEFYLAVVVLFATTFGVYVSERDGPAAQPWLRAGFVQPYIPQTQKWDPAEAGRILGIIERETKRVAASEPDLILWPEAVTPIPLLGDDRMRQWVERVATEAGAPIVLGALAYETDAGAPAAGASADENGRWTNGVFLAEPDSGLSPQIYRKRHLVPFGEYVPLRRLLPFVEKFVPIGGDISPGHAPAPLLVNTPSGAIKLGPLVCYEDVFPGLARASVLAGADALFVATNDAWYGETGAAYQHAAHSVVRAVETRRPVLRDGNGGWSGWIDENGVIRAVVEREGSVYFRGVDTVNITRNPRWIGRLSFYVQHGDWFVVVSAALAIAMVFLLRSARFRFDPAAAKAVRVQSTSRRKSVE